jgi:hypothetical protein
MAFRTIGQNARRRAREERAVSSTAPKADKAREALEWCRYGHRKMRSNPTMGPDWVLDWVLIWAGTIALLRAVGHVLVNEDAESDARVKEAQRAWWDTLKATKPNPSIFWEFIERDRNLLLKGAELTVEPSATVFVSGGAIPLHAPRPPPPPPPIYNYKMKSGRFAGQDPRDLVRDAIEWWEKQLDDIERKAAASSP